MLTLDFFPNDYDRFNIEWAIDRTFNYQFQPEWMNSNILKRAVEHTSHMHWEGGFVFLSKKDGRAYSHQELATGVKSLALMMYFQKDQKPTWYKSSTFGANVFEYICQAALETDINLIICSDSIRYPNYSLPQLKVKWLQSDQIYFDFKGIQDVVEEHLMYLNKLNQGNGD